MYTREEFETERKKWAEQMAQDKTLKQQMIATFCGAIKHNWVYQTNFKDEPSLQTAEDLLMMMEIARETKPEIVVELGVAWGGTMLALESISMDTWIFGVDKYLPMELQIRLQSKAYGDLFFFEGNTIDSKTIEFVKRQCKGLRTMLILDSVHTTEHVFAELEAYSDLVTKGQYIIVCDTGLLMLPNRIYPKYTKSNNPQEGLDKFMVIEDGEEKFVVDQNLQNKMLFRFNTYLRCVK